LPATNSTIVIYGTHLDVTDASEATRLEQIQTILERANKDTQQDKQVIIMGDMNAIDPEDYRYFVSDSDQYEQQQALTYVDAAHEAYFSVKPANLVSQQMKNAGFQDCFEFSKQQRPLWTTWTGTRVDRIYVSKNWQHKIQCYPYVSGISDHLPLIMDIDCTQ